MIKFEIDLSEFRKLDLSEADKVFLLRFAYFYTNEGHPYIQINSGEKCSEDEFYIYSDGDRMGTMYFPSANSFSSIPLVDFGKSPHFFRSNGDFFIHKDLEAGLSNVVAFIQKCFVKE